MNVSGELFDLSIPTFNNEFGYEQLIENMKYGIYIPIDKYIHELDMILNGDRDDKTEKREFRRDFLKLSAENDFLYDIFPLYHCYINGGGSNPAWNFGQYNSQNLILTVAGGNIITIFAQLIINMIDILILCSETHGAKLPAYVKNWSILTTEKKSRENIRDLIIKYNNEDQILNKETLKGFFQHLTPTNQLLLGQLENIYETHDDLFSKELIWLDIVIGAVASAGGNDSLYDKAFIIAKKDPSDFDFKLSLNIHPKYNKKDYFDIELNKPQVSEEVNTLRRAAGAEKGAGAERETAGFFLLRAKTFFKCETDENKTPNKLIKEWQKDCHRFDSVKSIYKSLFTQTMADSYIEGVEREKGGRDSKCWKFLNHLKKKKEIIANATKINIDEIVQFFLKGVYKQINLDIHDNNFIVQVAKQKNTTESVITYLNQISFNLNTYIKLWLQDRLIYQAGYRHGPKNAPNTFADKEYKDFVNVFRSLDTLLKNENKLIPRLATDLIITFLNQPTLYTENILDALLLNLQNKGERCEQPPSEVVIPPVKKNLHDSLKIVKTIIESLEYDTKQPELEGVTGYDECESEEDGDDEDGEEYFMSGLPDGIRITINAIETDNKFQKSKPLSVFDPKPIFDIEKGINPEHSEFNKIDLQGAFILQHGLHKSN